jgi:hypothetical protein
MTTSRLGALGTLAVLFATACATDQSPTTPGVPAAPDLTGSAFALTIDVSSGQITVAPPVRPSNRSGGDLALSLVGSEAIELLGTGQGGAIACRWSTVPSSSKQKRCTFDFTVSNHLTITDLVAPTTFPRPPLGATGPIVFPFSASALPSGTATPNADWQHPPTNLFNDVTGCTSSKTSDCYRWESLAGPLAAGTTSSQLTVGFDVDKAAQRVTVYLVVAADLRDNPPRALTLTPDAGNGGTIFYNSSVDTYLTTLDPPALSVPQVKDVGYGQAYFSFALSGLPAGAKVVSATLRVDQTAIAGSALALEGVVVDHLDYGTLDDRDIQLVNLETGFAGFAISAAPGFRSMSVTDAVIEDLVDGRTYSQYSLRLLADEDAEDASVDFAGLAAAHPPELEIVYRVP